MTAQTIEKVLIKLINLPMKNATNKHKKILEDSIIHLITTQNLEEAEVE